MEKVNKTSENTENDNLEKLREVFPEFVKDGIVDFDALKAFFERDGKLPENQEKYGLNWAGKSNAFNAIKVPATGTLTPDEKESKDFENTENLFIEGDNLEVLKLLQKHYREKIKMIYIDPPYNTGKDFIYKDNFTEDKSDYYERTGQNSGGIAMTTNRDSYGRYHSDWLTMMYPRLFLARNLLKDDGVIFISIDDNEVVNLRLIMDEIFGEENFVAQFIWKSRQNKDNRNLTGTSVDHEYILGYSKNFEYRALAGSERRLEQYQNPDNDPRGQWVSGNMVGLLPENMRPNCHYNLLNPQTGVDYGKPKMGWRYDKKTMANLVEDGRILWPSDPAGRPRRKVFLEELSEALAGYSSIIGEHVFTRNGTQEIEELMGQRYFDFPKPIALIEEFIKQSTEKDSDDIILDFFAGSGTTANAVMSLNIEDGGNRKWVCVQLPETTDENSEARKAGFENIAQIARERIRRAGDSILNKTKQPKISFEQSKGAKIDTGFKTYVLSRSNYREWNVLDAEDNSAKLKEQMRLIKDKPLVDGFDEKSVVYEILAKEGFDLNSEVKKENDGAWNVCDCCPELNSGSRKLIVSFADKLSQEEVDSCGLGEGDLFVCLDSALDDTTKVNILRRKFDMKVI